MIAVAIKVIAVAIKVVSSSNDGSKNNIENSTPDLFGNPSLEEDNGNKNDENKEKSNANSPDFISEGENTNDKTPTFLKEPSGSSDILDTDPNRRR